MKEASAAVPTTGAAAFGKTRLAGITLGHPLMNAAGTCKTLEDVRQFAASSLAAIMLGSISVKPRVPNPMGGYWKHPDGWSSHNVFGLPNPGLERYAKLLPDMKRICEAADKPFVVSVVGFSPEEYGELVHVVSKHADLVEVNLSCPNVWQGGRQEEIACFNTEAIESIWRQVRKHTSDTAAVGVKLSPFSNPAQLAETAALLGKLDVRFVTTSNTFPNGVALDDSGSPVIGTEYAGLGGPALKPIALGQVKQLRKALPKKVDVVGVGGILSAADMRDYLAVGASAVQAASAFYNGGRDSEAYATLLDA